jgi:acyl-coenzyme A thioesterase PaaI-like protein
VASIHLNGNGTLHGGVYASLIDNAMGLSVAALVGLRTATIGLDVHFLGAVRERVGSPAPPRSSTAHVASPPSRPESVMVMETS